MYTSKSIRDSLWQWGDNVRHGYWRGHTPADPDTPRLAAHFASRLPCHAEHVDLCRAFAALSPSTRGLADGGDMAWFAHIPGVTRQQLGIWLYYVDAWGSRRFREDWRAMSPEARDDLLELDRQRPGYYVVPEDARGDVLVAARLGVKRATVYRDRNEAIDRMLAFLQPSRPAESAA